MAELSRKLIPAPIGGIDEDTGFEGVDAVRARRLVNFLTDHSEKITLRGGMYTRLNWVMDEIARAVGVWQFNYKFLIGLGNHGGVEPPFAPTRATAEAQAIDHSIYVFDPAAVTPLTELSSVADKVPFDRGTRLGLYVYGFAYGRASGSVADAAGKSTLLRHFLRWDGSATVPVVYANAPKGGQAVTNHLNRVWVLGGTDPATPTTAPIEYNTLYFSDDGGPTTDTLAKWQDDVSGLVNKIVVGSNDTNDWGVALARFQQNLIIFKRHAVYVLYGTSPDTFTLRAISTEVGCVDPRSVVETDEGVYFMSESGYRVYDGSQVQEVDSGLTERIEKLTIPAVVGNTLTPANLGRVVAAPLPNNYIRLCVSDGANVMDSLIHTPSNSWSDLEDDIVTGTSPQLFGGSQALSLAIVGATDIDPQIVDFSGITAPEAVPPERRFRDEIAPSTIASSAFGTAGTGNGQFNFPFGLDIDGSGNIFVVDTNNHRVQKFNSAGVYQSQFGGFGTGDGQFNLPLGLDIDGSGNIFVADTNNHRVQKFNSAGVYQSQFGGFGTGNGQFDVPFGAVVDGSGNIFVVDTNNHRVQKFNSAGVFQMKFGGSGTGNGQFNFPFGLDIDGSGNIFVTDTFNHRVQKFNSAGVYQSQFGGFGTGDGQLSGPSGINLDGSGNIWVAEVYNARIQKFNSAGVFQMKFGSPGSALGQYNYPQDLLVTGTKVLVVDSHNNRVQVVDLAAAPSAYEAFDGEWYSGTFSLASPLDRSQLHRLEVSHSLRIDGTAAADTGWRIRLIGLDGTELLASTNTDVTNDQGVLSQRAVFDCFSEVEEVQLQILTPSPVLENLREAELYGASIEYQITSHSDDS